MKNDKNLSQKQGKYSYHICTICNVESLFIEVSIYSMWEDINFTKAEKLQQKDFLRTMFLYWTSPTKFAQGYQSGNTHIVPNGPY